MTSKHTPGPWHAAEDLLSDQGYVTDIVAGNTRIASAEHNWNEAAFGERRISWAEAQANAQLIAEAPAMLEALRAMLADIPADPYLRGPHHDAASAILARIDGLQR